jgi:hypothetical protein
MNLPEAVNMRVKASFSLPVFFLETSRSSEYEGKTSFSFSDIFHKRLGWSRMALFMVYEQCTEL